MYYSGSYRSRSIGTLSAPNWKIHYRNLWRCCSSSCGWVSPRNFFRVDEKSRKYTAFAVPGSDLWQFKRMSFGLTNAPATFQKLIEALFAPEMEPYVFGYLDDTIIATESFEEHKKWLEIVLTKIKDAQLTVNWKKCKFGCARVRYPGYLLD